MNSFLAHNETLYKRLHIPILDSIQLILPKVRRNTLIIDQVRDVLAIMNALRENYFH